MKVVLIDIHFGVLGDPQLTILVVSFNLTLLVLRVVGYVKFYSLPSKVSTSELRPVSDHKWGQTITLSFFHSLFMRALRYPLFGTLFPRHYFNFPP